jgi:beta-lactamase regulating signal transducer with metallopeptidase domain
MSQGKMQSSPGPKINGKQLLPKQKIASNNPSGNPEDSQEQNSAGSGKDFLSKLLNNPLLHTILKWLLLLLLLFALLRWILSWFRRRNMLSARNIPTFDGSSNIERDNRTVGVNNSNSGDGTAGRNSNGSDEETQTAVTKAPGSVYQQSGYSEVKEKWFRRGSNFFSWLLILGLLLLLLLLTLAFAKFLPAFVAHFPAFGVQEKLFDLPQLDSTQKRVIYFLIGILFGLIVFFLFRLIFAPVRGFDNIPQKLSTGLARMYIWSSVTRVASVSVALIPGIVLLGIALAMAKKSANFEQSNSIVMAAISVLFVGLIFVVYHTLSTLVLDRIFADDKHREEKEEVLLHCREKGLDISEETVEFQLSKAARSCMGCTYGGLLMKPRIAIAPNANSLGQSPEERRQLALAVVAHEFAHIQRRDVILSQLTTVLRWIPFLRGLWSAESRATEILTDITAALSSPDIARALHRLFIRLQKSTGSSANRDNTTHPALTKRAAVMSDIIEFNANTGQKDDASPELSYMFRLWLWTFLGAALLVFFVWFIVELKKAREYTPRYEEIVEKWKESEQKRNKSNPAEENK